MEKTLPKNQTPLRDKFLSFIKKSFAKDEENTEAIERQNLLSEIEEAISDIRHARNCFEEARDPEMIEACIFEIKSAEARYSFLLRKAKLMSVKL